MGPVRVIVPNLLLDVWKDLAAGEEGTLEKPLDKRLVTLSVHKESHSTVFEVSDAAVHHTAAGLICDLTRTVSHNTYSEDSEDGSYTMEQPDLSVMDSDISDMDLDTEEPPSDTKTIIVDDGGCQRTYGYAPLQKKLKLMKVITAEADSLSPAAEPNIRPKRHPQAPPAKRYPQAPPAKRITRSACLRSPPAPYKNTRSEHLKPLPRRPVSDSDLQTPPADSKAQTRCLLCGLLFGDFSGFQMHLKIHHELLPKEHWALWTEHQTVEERRNGIEELRMKSQERMKETWRVCHVCFVPCANLIQMMHHMGVHSTHIEYNSIIQKIQEQMKKESDENSGENVEDTKTPLTTVVPTPSEFCSVCDKNLKNMTDLCWHLKHIHKLTFVNYLDLFGEKSIKTEEERQQIKKRLLESMCTQKIYYQEDQEEREADIEDKNSSSSSSTSSSGANLGVGQGHVHPKKSLTYLKPMVMAELKDEALALLDVEYKSCLLCGRVLIDTNRLKHHLYICHKVTYAEQRGVLLKTVLADRKAAFEQLQENSRDQMRHSGKHCPICYGQSLKPDVLISHMAFHSDHPQYDSLFDQLKQTIKLGRILKKAEPQLPSDTQEQVKAALARCVICDKHFLAGTRLHKHVVSFHEYSWMNYVRLISTAERSRKERVRMIKNNKYVKNNPVLNPVNQDGSLKKQVIECMVCKGGFLCEEYRTHLENVHPQEDIDTQIELMENALIKSSFSSLSEIPVSCPFCMQIFTKLQVFKHMKFSHSQEPTFDEQFELLKDTVRQLVNSRKCDVRKERCSLGIKLSCRHCGNLFADASTRSYHENYGCAKNPNRQQKFVCKFCSQKGTSAKWLEGHLKQHNQDGPNYICHLCGNSYRNRSGINTHMAKDHENVVKFCCDKCDKTFYVSTHYTEHMKKHAKDEANTCPECHKLFKSREQVDQHVKSVHSVSTATLPDIEAENLPQQQQHTYVVFPSLSADVQPTPDSTLQPSFLPPTSTPTTTSLLPAQQSSEHLVEITLNPDENSAEQTQPSEHSYCHNVENSAAAIENPSEELEGEIYMDTDGNILPPDLVRSLLPLGGGSQQQQVIIQTSGEAQQGLDLASLQWVVSDNGSSMPQS